MCLATFNEVKDEYLVFTGIMQQLIFIIHSSDKLYVLLKQHMEHRIAGPS